MAVCSTVWVTLSRMLDAHKFPGCSGVWRIAIYRLTIEVGVAARSGSIVLVSNEELCRSTLYVLILKTILCSTWQPVQVFKGLADVVILA